jgi:(4S)-4-hydroxy-5-phosphonooxypentane-2,3-dione isomerase
MAKVSVIATIKAKDGRGDDIVNAFNAAAPIVRQEAGTEAYGLHRNANDPNVLYVVEIYSNQAAFDAHMTGEGVKVFGSRLGDAIDSFDMQFATPLSD